MGSDSVDYENNIEQEENNNSFREYTIEDKVYKNSFKRKIAQAKRLLANQASKEYSQVDEQNDDKSVPKMLASVSKITELKAFVNTKTKKYGKPTSPTYLSNGSDQ